MGRAALLGAAALLVPSVWTVAWPRLRSPVDLLAVAGIGILVAQASERRGSLGSQPIGPDPPELERARHRAGRRVTTR